VTHPTPDPPSPAAGPARTDSFAEFLGRLQAQDGSAARDIFQRFAGQLIALARRKFEGALRHKVDPEDVVQSAYKSFFGRYGEGNLRVENWNSLWGLLTLITVRKCAERVAYHRAECRDAAREASAPPGAEEGAAWPEVPGREPTPAEAAQLAETVAQLLAGLDGDERPVVELSLQGYTTQEISQRLGCPERSVRRWRERVRTRLEQMQREGG
jgi:RNA polymerase sigma-70 factor (ECF subfamily)